MQLLDRRGKVVHEREMQVWRLLTKDCMSEESDNEDGTKTRRSPKWRSERMFYHFMHSYINYVFEQVSMDLSTSWMKGIKRSWDAKALVCLVCMETL